MDELTPRKQQILRAVVIEYVETAEPVGSGLLVERYQLGVGPATVRHELAEMSERGYLEQPHTSAGRIPSDAGYRYYVDRLSEPQLTAKEHKQVRDVSKGETDLEDLLVETCKVLSRLSHHVSFATTVGERNLSVRGVSITGVTRERALMAVVLSNGMVDNRILSATPDLTLADLHEVSLVVSEACSGKKIRPLLRVTLPTAPHLRPPAQDLLLGTWKALKAVCRNLSAGKVVTEGTQFLFEQPEFQQDVKALGQILSSLESGEAVQGALEPQSAPTSVSIGKENAPEALSRLAIIASRFYLDNEEAGTIAIAGPTRMKYSSAMPLVETAAKALTDALTRLIR